MLPFCNRSRYTPHPHPPRIFGIFNLARNCPQNPSPKGLRVQNIDYKGVVAVTLRRALLPSMALLPAFRFPEARLLVTCFGVGAVDFGSADTKFCVACLKFSVIMRVSGRKQRHGYRFGKKEIACSTAHTGGSHRSRCRVEDLVGRVDP